MQEIVHQLGELFLQAVPTVLIVLAFYVMLRALFFKPLLAGMAERDARTVGARKGAAAAGAAAAEKVKYYQGAQEKALVEVYPEQDAAPKKVLEVATAVVAAGLIAWVFLKLTPPFFRKNAETISSAITKATAAKAEADRQLREAEEKLARLEQEVAQLRATAQQEMTVEAERLRAITQSDIEKIGLAAKVEIEAAERAARVEVT